MATATATPPLLSGLARCLVDAGLLTEEAAGQHQEQARRQQIPLSTYLVANKVLAPLEIARTASQQFGVPLFDLNAMDMAQAPIDLVSDKLIQKHHVLPLFRRGNHLFVAVSDPTNFQGLDEIKFHTGLNTETVVVEEDKLAKAIDVALEAADSSMQDLLDEDLDNLQVTNEEEETAAVSISESELEDAPIVRFVNKVLLDSIKKGASDIHLEPYEKSFRIRLRIDGILHEVASPPPSLATRIISRIKVMSRMDIAERRLPQDGRIKMKLSRNKAIDFRVNTCPTLFGEKVVLRLLDPTSAQIGIDKLGFEPDQQELFLKAIHKPYGMILVTGPTGSGKTVTLYTALNILNTPDRNISTAEDPVEITVPGINQVNVHPKAGLTFAEALRAFLRQDPDIIMVGEIRDLETAEIAVKAAQTGHMVLSTLHTNDAPQTLNRLAQMGVPPFNIASSINLILAQRLARRLCQYCKQEARLPPEVLVQAGFREDELDDLVLFSANPEGCDHCTKGYKGRVGIYQVMPISPPIQRLIIEGANAMQLADQARQEGINDLRASGLNKVREGITTLEEIDRVTQE
ncbi:type IV pilus assembly protein PilB [Methylomarinovum caldicuralii]|uniref:Type IV pilus assembly protein PilB n=1 Tax=Methylomarinovum caldicuralii TaxID=438856 RepID=A0AAU9C9G0_9GAMM|nr:type IV-A pilus assembly ATPase PilB [Methylomarinovum caldicuralii]BCX82664.1 type IV pilus assembly protein PilB [Methylomarinovum caldicuralii]